MLTDFPKAMSDNVEAVVRTGNALRYVRDSSGDLRFSDINKIQEGLRDSKVSVVAVLTEAQKSPVKAEEHMVSLNGPSSLVEYQTLVGVIEEKSAAWNDFLASFLSANFVADDLIGVQVINDNSITTRHIVRKDIIVSAKADLIRNSTELQELATSFEAVGA